jgi:hypothetical protein
VSFAREPCPAFRSTNSFTAIAIAVLFCVGATDAAAQIQFERKPISYSERQPNNRVTELNAKIESGAVRLDYSESHGYLKSLLQHLGISVQTQMLVFSKTSHQRYRISPQTPRAVYFNDDVYLGWVQGGDVIEISVADPQLGAVFYTIDQTEDEWKPTLSRQLGRCTLCHASTHTGRIPGHIVRSVYPNNAGRPILAAGTFRTTPRSPIHERWGGWYVTGTLGTQRHLGNVWVEHEAAWRDIDVEAGANILDLSKHVDLSPYLSPHSDVVALMVMEHQIDMHNLFTSASIEWRLHWYEAQQINQDNGISVDHMSDESSVRLGMIARRVVDGLLMKDETRLTSEIQGTSRFEEEFSNRDPHDEMGRSLRQFNLKQSLFRYPCSYTIYSPAFDALPERLRQTIYEQLWAELSGAVDASRYGIDAKQRQASLEILRATKTGLPASWYAH